MSLGEELPEYRRRCHSEDELQQILGLIHHLGERLHDVLELLVELVPDQRFDRVGVVEADDFDLHRLPVAVQPPDPLMHPHGIPRQVDVDETVAAFLKVDAFSAGLR